MKYIFTDIDGVLNNANSREEKNTPCCIDGDNLHVFAEFVRWCHEKFGEDNVRIVLTASWRKSGLKDECARKVLDEYIENQEGLKIDDETEHGADGRGLEIIRYLNKKNDCTGYVVLDDVLYTDFKPLRITSHLVQTADEPQNGRGGLRDRHLKRAKEIIERAI